MDSVSDARHAENVARVQAVVLTLRDAFPSLNAQFERNHAAWKGTWFSNAMRLSSRSSDRATGPEWDRLTALGPKILPLVVNKLQLPDENFSVNLYNALQSDPSKKVPRSDVQSFYDLSLHSRKIIDFYATHIAAFEDLVSSWKAHQTRVSLSSISSDYLRHDSVRAIVAMGKDQVLPLAMAQYARDGGWWHEVLYELVNGTQSGSTSFNMPELYQQWKTWFEA